MFDERFNQLLIKHEIDIVDEQKLNDNLDLSIKGILTEKCAGRRCALWGAGRMNTISSHTAILIGKYATYLQSLVCVIDSDPDFQGKTFLGFPIIAPDHILDYDIDIIVISSKNSSNSIIESLYNASPSSSYVDIYAELNKKGLEVYNNFFDERSIYTQIFELQMQYREADTIHQKEIIVQTLISFYLGIRDFYYAFHYMDIFIKNTYINYKKYVMLKEDIIELLNEMKAINEQKSEDISFFYIDALRNIDVIDSDTGVPKLLYKYLECAKTYLNVYSTGATTYESMVSAILGKYPLECNVYSQNFLRSVDEVEAIKNIYNNGYDLNWMVSDCYRLLEEDKRLNFDIQIYMSKKLWNVTCSLAESANKTFNFIYFPYEIHCPMLCGFHKEKPVIRGFSNMGIEHFPESIDEQYNECLDYMDKQFDFYYELLGSSTTKVIFSDHSQVVYDKNNNKKTYNMYYKDKELTSHIPLIISRKSQPYKSYEGYMSMIDFNQIVISIVNNDDMFTLEKEIIRYQYYPIHSAKIRLHAIECGFDDYIDGMDIFASKQYIYIKTGTGKEEVFRHKDLECNLINEQEGKAFKNKVVNNYSLAF